MKSIVYIGMDVHKNSYSLCAMHGYTGEILGETRIVSDIRMVEKFIENIRKKSEEEVEIKTGYEAGCLGYSLYNELKVKGIECDILAPTTMQKSAKNKVKKNDRMDAKNIAANLANNTYKKVYVPCEEDVEVKEYIRMLNDFKDELKKVKQHINAFALRLGLKYPGKSRWIEAHIKWLKSVEISELYREILNEYLSEYDSLKERIERFNQRLKEMSQKETYREKVSELRCFKGIDTTAAMTMHVEISDFNRFPNADAFSAYLGLTPGDNSSGDRNSHTGITKQGNSTVRATMVECAQALVKGTIGVKSKRIKARQAGQDVRVIDYADRAVIRLQKKFHKMIKQEMPRNKAITAVARELACFVWGMETGNID